MHDWKIDSRPWVAETMAFANSVRIEIQPPRPLPVESLESSSLSAPDYGGSEREEIMKRVDSFQAHQKHFTREREEYANSQLRRIRPTTRA